MSTRVHVEATLTGDEAESFRPWLPKAQREMAKINHVNCLATEVKIYVTVRYTGHRLSDGQPYRRMGSAMGVLDQDDPWLPYAFPDFAVREVVKALPGLERKRQRSTERERVLAQGVT